MSLWLFMGLGWLSTIFNIFTQIPTNLLSKRINTIQAADPEERNNTQCSVCGKTVT